MVYEEMRAKTNPGKFVVEIAAISTPLTCIFNVLFYEQVRDCLEEGCDKMGVLGGLLTVSDVNVMFLLLNHTMDPNGDIYKSMLNSQLNKVSLFNFGKDNMDWTVSVLLIYL